MLGLPKGKVFLAPWDDTWEAEYLAEKARIEGLIGAELVSCHHVGSTAVPGLAAKPIIDISVEIRAFDDGFRCAAPLAGIGYRHRIIAELPDEHYFSKGEPRTHQIHMFPAGSVHLKRQIVFRDLLRENEKARAEYQALKERFAEKHGADKLAYTDAKTDFINKALAKLGL